MEIWKVYKNFDKYQFSNMGRVKMVKKSSPRVWKRPDIRLRRWGEVKTFSAKRIFAELFVGNPNNYKNIVILNLDERLIPENLKWVPASNLNTISDEKIYLIHELSKYNLTHTLIARVVGIDEKTVRNYRSNKKG